ncbi:MAG: VanZ family protein [Nitrospinaceae bacterium]
MGKYLDSGNTAPPPWLVGIPALLFILVIFSTLSIVPEWWGFFLSRYDPSLLTFWIKISLTLPGVGLVCYLTVRDGQGGFGHFLWLASVLLASAILLATRRFPAEQIHLLEYGILGWLIYLPLRGVFPDRTVYPAAWLITFGVGIIDEWVQYYLPGRVGDLPDIFMNGASAGLAMILLAKVLPSPFVEIPVSPGNVRKMRRTAWGVLLLLLFFIPTVTP